MLDNGLHTTRYNEYNDDDNDDDDADDYNAAAAAAANTNMLTFLPFHFISLQPLTGTLVSIYNICSNIRILISYQAQLGPPRTWAPA